PGRARLATRPAPTGSEDVVTTMGNVVVALLAANPSTVPPTTTRSTFRPNQDPGQLRQALTFLLCEPVLDGNILSLDPTELAQLLPECVQKPCHPRSSA